MRITEVLQTQQEIDDLWAAYDDDSSGDLVKCTRLLPPPRLLPRQVHLP